MQCKTCTHTMQNIAPDLFWCPRCGSILFRFVKGGDEWSFPKLIHNAFCLSEAIEDAIADITSHVDCEKIFYPVENADSAVRECCLLPEER